MDNQTSNINSKYIIEQVELMNLKKTHYINTNNSIFRKAHLKYRLLFILSCLTYFLLYIGIDVFL
ncbi:MAG: hypothetical protein IJR82_05760 [Bacilli bacterium]|nr:hypothetical protein [Bacilli bacterium]